jgi:hypothetical protein
MPKKTKKSEKKKVDTDWYDPAEAGQDSLEWLKAEPGKVTRVMLMAAPHREYCSYIERNKVGSVQTLTKYEIIDGRYREMEPGLDQELTGKPPEPRYIVPVVVYDVKNDGTLGKKTDIEDVEFKFVLWGMSKPIYERLFKQFKQWGKAIFQHDLLLTGVKKGEFTFFDDVSVAPEAFALDDDLEDKVDSEWKSYKFRESFKDKVGKVMTAEELKEATSGKDGD